jgi:hypothetical protein
MRGHGCQRVVALRRQDSALKCGVCTRASGGVAIVISGLEPAVPPPAQRAELRRLPRTQVRTSPCHAVAIVVSSSIPARPAPSAARRTAACGRYGCEHPWRVAVSARAAPPGHRGDGNDRRDFFPCRRRGGGNGGAFGSSTRTSCQQCRSRRVWLASCCRLASACLSACALRRRRVYRCR